MQFWSKFSIVTWLPGPCVVTPCASRRTLSPALLSSQPAPQSRETHWTREQNLPAQACELKSLHRGCSCNVNGARALSLGVSSALFLRAELAAALWPPLSPSKPPTAWQCGAGAQKPRLQKGRKDAEHFWTLSRSHCHVQIGYLESLFRALACGDIYQSLLLFDNEFYCSYQRVERKCPLGRLPGWVSVGAKVEIRAGRCFACPTGCPSVHLINAGGHLSQTWARVKLWKWLWGSQYTLFSIVSLWQGRYGCIRNSV